MGFADEDYHPKAPWNQENSEHTFGVTVKLTSELQISVPKEYSYEEAKQAAADEAVDFLAKYNIGWDIKEVTVE